MNRPLTLTLLATLCLLLNSCITQLQVGEVIRDTPRTDYYGDARHIVGDVAYQISPTDYVQQVAVVTSKTAMVSMFINYFDDKLTSPYYTSPAEQNGEFCWIQLSTTKPKTDAKAWRRHKLPRPADAPKGYDPDYIGPGIWVKVLEQAPSLAHAKKVPAIKLDTESRDDGLVSMYSTTINNGVATRGQVLAAAPFDYFIDPIMSVPLTAVTYAGGIAFIPFIPFFYLYGELQE